MNTDSSNFDTDPSNSTTNNSIPATIPKRKMKEHVPPESKKYLSNAAHLRRSLTDSAPTDSDIELDNAAAIMSPAIRLARKNMQKKSGRILAHNSVQCVDLTVDDEKNIYSLPDEILQEIFCQLPTIDLVHCCSVVSHRFHDIIIDPTYLPWKKLYARYSCRDAEAVNEVEHNKWPQLNNGGNGSIGSRELIKYMAKVQLIDKEANAALDRLSRHPLYNSAVILTKKLLIDGETKEKDDNQINLGALVATLVLISDGVESLSYLIDLLTAQPANCKTIYWMEYFYCLLTLLSCSFNLHVLTDGRRHYQLKYAIYLFENYGHKSYTESATKASNQNKRGQQCLDKYIDRKDRPPTYEQYRIIGYDLQPTDYVRIIAFAGTGKTTTLIEYCRARASKKFLILFFNRDVAEDATARFPSNATCKTVHRLAYSKVGWKYGGSKFGNLYVETILKLCPDFEGLDRYSRAELVRQTLENYFASDQDDITSACAPETHTKKRKDKATGITMHVQITLEFDIRMKLVAQAEKTWAAMQNLNNKEVKMTHDGYLKLYQLSNPKIYGYDAILVDEAQDCTPATLDIVKRQQVPKILVGDGYQQIYSFRGAINALNTIPSTKTFYLTQSFRFGPEIAFVANAWMRSILGEKKKYLVGCAKPSRLDGVIEGQLAIICRTNYFVFNESVVIAEREKRPCLLMGSARKPFDFVALEAIFYLYLSDKSQKEILEKPDHWYLKAKLFKTFQEAKDYGDKTMDKELTAMIRLVEKHKVHTGERIKLLKSCLVKDPKTADFIVTTAHKSKGLEFKNVRLANDFADAGETNNQGDDEFNLIYVAMTRAINSLIISDTVYEALFNRYGPLFHTPIIGDDILVCSSCGRTSKTFLAHKSLAFTYGDSEAQTANLKEFRLCKTCVTNVIQTGEANYGIYSDNTLVKTIETDKLTCFDFYLPFLD